MAQEAIQTRQDLVVPQNNGQAGPATSKPRRYDHNEFRLRKRSDVETLGKLSGVQAKGQFSAKFVEDNLVTGICDALEKFSAQKLFRKQPATLAEAVDAVVAFDFVLTRMARVASVYQARSPDSKIHRVLLPLDPLDQDPDQADLAVVCAEVVKRIPELVPDARGVYEAHCIGFGNRPAELTGPATTQPPASKADGKATK